jgi:hypothetical protein
MKKKLEELKYFRYLMIGTVLVGSALTLKDNCKDIKSMKDTISTLIKDKV